MRHVREPETVFLARRSREDAEARRAAITEDSKWARAAAACRDQRSIGTTRTPVYDLPEDEF